MLRDRLDGLGTTPPRDLMVAGDDLERTHPLGEAGTGGRDLVHLLVRRRPGAARRVPGIARGQRRRRMSCATRPTRRPSAAPSPRKTISGPRRRKDRSSPCHPSENPTHAAAARTSSKIVTAKAPHARNETIEGITLTHPDRALWPGITKHDLVEYWQTVADHALPGLAHRPLAMVRCPSGIEGEHFFQKHGHGTMPAGCVTAPRTRRPYLAIDGLQGLVALAQMSAIELHVWGVDRSGSAAPRSACLRPRSR